MTPAKLLETLVGIPSVSGSEGALSEFLAQHLASLGFKPELAGDNLWFEAGKGSPRLLFVSHLDTVPPCAGWTTDPLQPHWQGESLHGLGANDAKGCVAAMILAAQMLVDLDGTAVFAFVREEERGGKGIQELLPKLGKLDAAVVGEPTGLKVCAAQRGMLVLKCAAKGISAHVAHAKLGENAIAKAARDMVKLESLGFEAHPLLGVTRPVVTRSAAAWPGTRCPTSASSSWICGPRRTCRMRTSSPGWRPSWRAACPSWPPATPPWPRTRATPS